MRAARRLALVVLFLDLSCTDRVLASPPPAVQEQTGIVEGVVRSTSGTPVPGALIEAQSAAVVGTTRTISRPDGTYRFPALPPATYVLVATASAFASTEVSVVVSVGRRTNIDITMVPAGQRTAETRSIAAASPLDVRGSARTESVTRTAIDRFPAASRDVTSVVAAAPGATVEPAFHQLQIDGASERNHRYLVDGLDVTDPRLRDEGALVAIDFVDQVQVKSSGHTAEFAGALGGVVSVITRSGSNRFRGSAGTYFEPEWLLGQPRSTWRINPFDNATPEFVTPPRDQWRHNSPQVDLGGPILPGRAWFFGGYSYDRNDYRRAAIFRDSPPPYERREFSWYTLAQYFNWSVNAQLRDGLRVKVSAVDRFYRSRGTAPVLQPNGSTFADLTPADGFTTASWDADPALYDRRWNQSGIDRPNSMFSAQADWVASPSLAVHVTSGGFVKDAHTPASFYGNRTRHIFGASNMTTAGVPAALRFPRGYVDNRSTSATARENVVRLSFDADAAWFHAWRGQHVVKAGVHAEQLKDDENSGDQKPDVTLVWDEAYAAGDGRLVRGPYGYYEIRQARTFGRSTSHALAFWLQDSWTIADRLTIDAGVRAENEHVGSYTSDPGLDWGLGDKIAPRLGFAYDLGGRGRSKVYGTYGWYYDTMKLYAGTGLLGAIRGDVFVYTLDTYDWPSIDCVPAAAGCPGTFIERLQPIVPGNVVDPRLSAWFGRPQNAIDPSMKPARTGEFTLGFDRALDGATKAGVRYVHKWLARTIEDVSVVVPGVGEVPVLGNPGAGMARVALPDYPQFPVPPAIRDYDAIELRVDRRARNWTVAASYTWSSLRGNYAGADGSDEGLRLCPGCTAAFDSPYSIWDRNAHEVRGPLPTDRPHLLKVDAGYELPWGTSVDVLFVAESGTPLSSRLSWKGGTIYFNGRGDLGRTPATTRLDLQLQHGFRLPGAHRVDLKVTVTNVFDQDTPTRYATSPWRDTFNLGNEVFFAGWDPSALAARIRAAGGTMRDNPLYMRPASFQYRRGIRLGVEYSF